MDDPNAIADAINDGGEGMSEYKKIEADGVAEALYEAGYRKERNTSCDYCVRKSAAEFEGDES